MGRARALQLALLGDKLPAADAAAMGLIARCVPDAELASQAMAMAQRLAAMPTQALVETRRAMDMSLDLSFEQALAAEAGLQSRLGYAADYNEGVTAFKAKRSPRFIDR